MVAGLPFAFEGARCGDRRTSVALAEYRTTPLIEAHVTTAPGEIRVDDGGPSRVGRLRPLQRAGASITGFASAFLGPAPPEEVSIPAVPHKGVEAPSSEAVAPSLPPAGLGRAHALTALYALVGFAGVLVVVASAPVWRNAAPTWRLTIPGIAHPPESSLHAAILFVGGLIAMWVGWVGMIGRAERMPTSPKVRLIVAVVVLVLWCIPPVLGTPMLSNDAYSYAAQGEMMTRGIDPTEVGPYALSRGPFLSAVDPIWRDAPAPYGPVAIALSELVVTATGNSPSTSVWMMRLLATAGVAMTAVGVVLIARRHRVPAAGALVAGVAGPLVLLHMIGGSHNDSLMMGLLTLGMAAFAAHRRYLSVLLVTLAVAVKLPAGVALAFIGWNWFGDRVVRLKDRVAATAGVGLTAGGLLVVLSVAGGIGAGWVVALSNTSSVTTTFSMSTKLGLLANDLTQLVGLDVSTSTLLALFRFLGLAAAGLICLWLLVRSPQIGVVRAVGLAMVVSVLLGPVVWPWYLPAGLALLAATGLGRWRPTYLVLVIAASTFVWPTSVDPVQSLLDVSHLLGLGFLALVVLIAFAAQRLSVRSAQARMRREARRHLTVAAQQRWGAL